MLVDHRQVPGLVLEERRPYGVVEHPSQLDPRAVSTRSSSLKTLITGLRTSWRASCSRQKKRPKTWVELEAEHYEQQHCRNVKSWAESQAWKIELPNHQ